MKLSIDSASMGKLFLSTKLLRSPSPTGFRPKPFTPTDLLHTSSMKMPS